MSHFRPPDSIRRHVGRPLSRRGGGWPRFSEPATRAGRPFTRLGCNNAGGGKSGAAQGRPLAEKGLLGPWKGAKRGAQPPEAPSVTSVRGEGEFEGEGGFSVPPAPSRRKWLQRGLPGSLEGGAQGSLALRKAFLTPKALEGGKQRFQYPKSRSLLKSPRLTLPKPAF